MTHSVAYFMIAVQKILFIEQNAKSLLKENVLFQKRISTNWIITVTGTEYGFGLMAWIGSKDPERIISISRMLCTSNLRTHPSPIIKCIRQGYAE